MTKEQMKELELASKTLVEFLKKNGNPLTIVTVTTSRVDLYSNEIGIPLEVDDYELTVTLGRD